MANIEQAGVYSIAIVEDDETFAIMLAYNIEALGISARWISRRVDIVPAITGEPPNAVVLDCSPKGMSGASVLQGLRANSLTRALPVLAITDGIDPRDVTLAYASGADCCLCKPFPLSVFLEKIWLLAGLQHAAGERCVMATT
jgi:two-component system phosphate regulon response regulator PhoB